LGKSSGEIKAVDKIKMTNEQLQVGAKYEVNTFYQFKTGPHNSIFLGYLNFREKNMAVFRNLENQKEDYKEYLIIDIDLQKSDLSRGKINSKLDDLENSEFVLACQANSAWSDRWGNLSDEEIYHIMPKLEQIL
jgi:hypothetical protein